MHVKKRMMPTPKNRNDRLHDLIFRHYPSIMGFCKDLKISPSELHFLLNRRGSPLCKNTGEYRLPCKKIAERFYEDIEELFPLELYQLTESELTHEMRFGQLPLQECTELESDNDPFSEVLMKERAERIEEVLATIKPRHAQILRMRFGLNDSGKIYTLDEIAQLWNTKRESIRQSQATALRKLRKSDMRKKLEDFA